MGIWLHKKKNDVQLQEDREKIRNSKHGRSYVEKGKLGRPEYTRKGRRAKDRSMKARVRLSNLENGNRY